MKRDRYQRKAYAMRRLSMACDRAILHIGDPEKTRRWAFAWARAAGLQPAPRLTQVKRASQATETQSKP